MRKSFEYIILVLGMVLVLNSCIQDEKYYKNYRMPDYEFLHKNILEVKDKANQEYLLNLLKQFKKEYDNYKPQKVYATL